MNNGYSDGFDANYQAHYFDAGALQTIQAARTSRRPVQPRTLAQYIPSIPPQHYSKVAAVFFVWLFGLYVMFWASAPLSSTPESIAAAAELNAQLKPLEAEAGLLENLAAKAHTELIETKTWFWWANDEQRKAVHEKQAVYQKANSALSLKQSEKRTTLLKVKSIFGLWSEAGVRETRTLFWNSFKEGKVFAKRQTLWDALFHILAAREKPSVSVLLELLFTTVINFTTGMLFSFFIFIAKLPNLILGYSPSLISGFFFVLTATIGALSVVCTFLATLYAAGAAAAYGLTTLFTPTRRLEGQHHRYYAVNYHVD